MELALRPVGELPNSAGSGLLALPPVPRGLPWEFHGISPLPRRIPGAKLVSLTLRNFLPANQDPNSPIPVGKGRLKVSSFSWADQPPRDLVCGETKARRWRGSIRQGRWGALETAVREAAKQDK